MLGQLYVVLLTIALLVALASGVVVLRGMFEDAQERNTQRHAGETDDEDGDGRVSSTILDDTTVRGPGGKIACKHCGTTNDPAYTYCQRCVTRL